MAGSEPVLSGLLTLGKPDSCRDELAGSGTRDLLPLDIPYRYGTFSLPRIPS